MKQMFVSAIALAITAIACTTPAPKVPTICAHRGFWKCEDVPNFENTLTSLRMAQEYGLWGSEFDVHITADDIVVVHHNDSTLAGLDIHTSTYEDLAATPLPNGEVIPTIDMYLEQGEKKADCMLVCEFKEEPSRERADKMIDVTIEALKAHNLFDPARVMFISFDLEVCKRIAAEYPEFVNQYLEGDLSPKEVKDLGINGIDYKYKVFYKHPEWIAEAHELGMSVNSWTVNTREDMEYLIGLGIDCITTNEPLLLREVLESK